MKCDTCMNRRPVFSENGWHSVCCLSSRKIIACLTEREDKYKPAKAKEDEANGT